MSSGGGSGGGNWRPHSNVYDNDKCDIVEETVLNSPNAAVVSTLSVGDILHIELEFDSEKRVVAKSPGGEIAGSITSTRLLDLIECIQEGHEYEAEVTSAQGGLIPIEIRRK